jgi:hypothetical protein
MAEFSGFGSDRLTVFAFGSLGFWGLVSSMA